jgi:hypothetical protein
LRLPVSWIAEHAGLRVTLLIAGLGAILLEPLVAWTSPLLRLRTLDEAQEPRQTESVAEEMAGAPRPRPPRRPA